MKQEDYIREIIKSLDENDQIPCKDCGEVSEMVHVIINHQDDTVKAVCDNCFKTKYQDFLYSEIGEGKAN